MMFNREEVKIFQADQVEDEIIIEDEFTNVITALKQWFQPVSKHPGFLGSYRPLQEGTAGTWKAAKSWDDFLKEAVKKPFKGIFALRLEKSLDGFEIEREV